MPYPDISFQVQGVDTVGKANSSKLIYPLKKQKQKEFRKQKEWAQDTEEDGPEDIVSEGVSLLQKPGVHADKQGPEQVLNKADYESGDPGSQASGIWNCSCCHNFGIQQVWGESFPLQAH